MIATTRTAKPRLPRGRLAETIDDPRVREAIRRADFIVGVDPSEPAIETLLWGAADWDSVHGTGRPRLLTVLRVPHERGDDAALV